jgi:serine/threonine protein phosphatase PrpC
MLFGTTQIDGRGRPTEDRVLVRKLIEGCECFAVFDGHSGSAVVRMTLELLPERIKAALVAAGPDVLRTPAQIVQILRTAFVEHDKELARSGKARDSGSTASVALVTDTHIIMAYLGDSPAFLMDPLTGLIRNEIGKHEPTLAKEAERIAAAGGTVEIDEYGTPRVDGSLMVSRAFGDFSLKFDERKPVPFEADWSRFKVTPYPDVAVWSRPNVGLLAIMSDGFVETDSGSLKPTAAVAKDIMEALKVANMNLQETAATAAKRHVAAATGNKPADYDGDDLSMVLVDVGSHRPATAQIGGAAARAAAAVAAAAAARPKTRHVPRGRRNKTGKKSRIIKILTA